MLQVNESLTSQRGLLRLTSKEVICIAQGSGDLNSCYRFTDQWRRAGRGGLELQPGRPLLWVAAKQELQSNLLSRP